MLRLARSFGLQGVEVDTRQLPDDAAGVRALRGLLEREQAYLIIDTQGYDPDDLSRWLRTGRELGAACVRTVAGGAGYGGDRRPLRGRWQQFMAQVLAGFRQAAAVAEQVQVPLAVENHQDLASEDLLHLCRAIDSPFFGIVLDTGNPLAVAEEPLSFTEALLPYIRNVHLKDYRIYRTESGYRLVRCPLGEGAVPLEAICGQVASRYQAMTCAVELGAHRARHVRLLEEDFWPDYAPRPASHLARTLRFCLAHSRPEGEPWQTPAEQGAGPEAITRFEEAQLTASLPYLELLSFA
jgi:3-oxoisoapionate decarboxylase